MNTNLLIGKGTAEAMVSAAMLNRHGMIAGATGTGKTVALQTIAEFLSSIGVPLFLAYGKGDLSRISQAGLLGSLLGSGRGR